MQTAIIIGVGPEHGLGAQLCKRFAGLGLHVFVAGRTRAKLDKVVALIEAEGNTASAYVADTTDEAQVNNLFDEAAHAGPLSVAIYNAGNNTPGKIIDMEASYFEKSWKICCFGGFLFARAALQQMQGSGGTLLFTGASASMRGRAGFGAFNSSKAALRVLAQALAKEYGPEKIHVGHVVVDGAINGEKIKTRWPEYAEKLGDEGMISIDGIVDAYEYLYRQPETAWTFEVDLRTAIENW
ncbi:MAG: SDR family NAD(P)-dependent oxidoreductase [Gammaproteobacteria bacterium]|nr:SDR family NAD(P)-dependent oxidoreductase [Gammaproteobacteria bacterium]